MTTGHQPEHRSPLAPGRGLLQRGAPREEAIAHILAKLGVTNRAEARPPCTASASPV